MHAPAANPMPTVAERRKQATNSARPIAPTLTHDEMVKTGRAKSAAPQHALTENHTEDVRAAFDTTRYIDAAMNKPQKGKANH